MTEQQQFLKALLNHEFYAANKHRLVETMFPDYLSDVYRVLVYAHEKYERDISTEELRALYRAQNPTASRATVNAVNELLTDLEEQDSVPADIMNDLLSFMWRQEIGRQIADYGLKLTEGEHEGLQDLVTLVEKVGDGFLPQEEEPPVVADIDALIDEEDDEAKWLFNIPVLRENVGGLTPGSFTYILARPEAGKTALWTALAAGPEGWVEQGATVAVFGNEEPVHRTMRRALSSSTGMTWDEIKADRELAKQRSKISHDRNNDRTDGSGQINMRNCVGMTMDALDLYVRTHKPDILVIDQLDKMGISGKFNRGDEKLKEIYVAARNIAIRHKISVVGVCQASAEAEGKVRITYSHSDNSRTGKGGEADLILGLAAPHDDNSENSNLRHITVSKNKITGWHGMVHCMIDPKLTRFTQ